MHNHFADRRGFSFMELMAVVAIIGALAAILVPRAVAARREAAEKTCYHNRLINVAVERYAVENGHYPADLSVLNVPEYFPQGIPACPVSDHAYTLDGSSHRVSGHAAGVHP